MMDDYETAYRNVSAQLSGLVQRIAELRAECWMGDAGYVARVGLLNAEPRVAKLELGEADIQLLQRHLCGEDRELAEKLQVTLEDIAQDELHEKAVDAAAYALELEAGNSRDYPMTAEEARAHSAWARKVAEQQVEARGAAAVLEEYGR